MLLNSWRIPQIDFRQRRWERCKSEEWEAFGSKNLLPPGLIPTMEEENDPMLHWRLSEPQVKNFPQPHISFFHSDHFFIILVQDEAALQRWTPRAHFTLTKEKIDQSAPQPWLPQRALAPREPVPIDLCGDLHHAPSRTLELRENNLPATTGATRANGWNGYSISSCQTWLYIRHLSVCKSWVRTWAGRVPGW